MKKIKIACIVGNGPSLRDFDFSSELKGFTTFGMNAAYRYWEKNAWYPQYYVCLDVNVGLSHKKAIARLIANSGENKIRRFLLRDEVVKELGELGKDPKVVTLGALFKKYPAVMRTLWLSTGSHAALWAILMGYNALILLGIDCNYVERLPESELVSGDKLIMAREPKNNPNYFCDYYQQKGDVYSVPNPKIDRGKADQISSWYNIYPEIRAHNAIIANSSLNSKLELFHKIPFREAKSWLENEFKRIEDKSGLFKNLRSSQYGTAAIPMDEVRILYPFMPKKCGNLLAIGDDGYVSKRFLDRGWRVWIGQADPYHRKCLNELAREQYGNLVVIERGFRETSDFERPWFVYFKDTRLNSMCRMNNGYIQNGTVSDITVEDCVSRYGIPHLDLMTIQANGFEQLILNKGLSEAFKPDHLIIEYNNELSLPHGFTAIDTALFLEKKDYSVYFSQWKNTRLPNRSTWEGFYLTPQNISSANSNGKILAFRQKPAEEFLKACVEWAVMVARGHASLPLPEK